MKSQQKGSVCYRVVRSIFRLGVGVWARDFLRESSCTQQISVEVQWYAADEIVFCATEVVRITTGISLGYRFLRILEALFRLY